MLAKARTRPDQVKQVADRELPAATDGVRNDTVIITAGSTSD